jgi:hypothetical protein
MKVPLGNLAPVYLNRRDFNNAVPLFGIQSGGFGVQYDLSPDFPLLPLTLTLSPQAGRGDYFPSPHLWGEG